MKRTFTFLMSLFLMIGTMWAQTNSYTRIADFEAVRTNSKVYALKATRSPLYFNTEHNELAGYWTASDQELQGSLADATQTAQQFAFLRTDKTAEGKYYMYSVEGSCFITVAGAKSETPDPVVWFADVTDKDDANHQGVKLYIGAEGNNVVNVTYWNNNTAGGVRYNDNTEADAGNVYELVEYDQEVILTEALAAIETFEADPEVEEPVVESNGAPAGNYYLYDVTSKTFLSRGDSWGTKAVTDSYGVPFAWDALPLGSLKFLDNNVCLFITEDGQAFTDNNSTGWTFEPVNDDTYRLKGTEDRYLKRTDNGVLELTTTAEEAVVWTFKTPAERDAIVAEYTTANYAAVIEAAGLGIEASAFVETLNTNYAGKDMTSSIGTAKFAGSVGDWTWTGVRGQGGQPAYGTDFAEVWQATGTYSQQVTGLPTGVYKLTVNGFHRQGGWAKCNELNEVGFQLSTATLEGNGQAVQLKPWVTERTGENNPNNTGEAVTAFNAGKYNNEVYVYVAEDGILDISVNIKNHVGDAWVLFNNFTLTYYTDQVSEEDATAIIAKAEGLTGRMETSVAEALASALEAFKASSTIVNYNTLSSAIPVAENSIAVYTGAGEYFTKVAGVLENTNVYTQEAYDAYYGDWLAGYEAGTLETATAATLNANTALGTGWHSANNIDDILLSAWTIGGEQANNYDLALYVNTWSTEGDTDGSEFFTPFFEYWTADANSLSAETMTATMEGLAPGQLYSLEAWVRVSAKEGVAAADATGITLSVGEGEPVDITEGEAIDGTRRSHAVFTAYGKADAEGKLTINFNVLEGNNISWLSFKNLKYTECNEPIEDYAEKKQAFREAVAAHIIGFAEGEYAPYTNIEGAKALAAAKAIDPDKEVYAKMKAAQDALEAVAVWTPNAEEMNAIYDGSFEYDYSAIEGNVKPLGWNRTSGANTGYEVRYITNVPEGATSSNKGMFIKFTANYGQDAGYTMPLKAKSAYALSFVYSGWGNLPTVGIVIEDEAGNAVEITPASITATADGQQDAANWQTYKGVFTTGDADANYILYFKKSETDQLQIAFGDFRLYTVVEVATVTLNKETIVLKKGATEQLVAAVAPADATFQELTWESDDKAVADVDENGLVTAVAAGSATITATSVNGVKAECTVVVSDVDTDIQTITTNTDAVIYDLSGRRVEKAVKGIYIVNGKKVIK